jgi:hypothetical protein
MNTRPKNVMNCTRMCKRFVFLWWPRTWNNFFWWNVFSKQSLDFDIYTMISIKHLCPQSPILHISSRPYYHTNKASTTIMIARKDKHASDHDLLYLGFQNFWHYVTWNFNTLSNKFSKIDNSLELSIKSCDKTTRMVSFSIIGYQPHNWEWKFYKTK